MTTAIENEELPKGPGVYQHWWTGPRGERNTHVLFVGYVDATKPLWQGTERKQGWQKMRCCDPDKYLHADCLTPEEWGGKWVFIRLAEERRQP